MYKEITYDYDYQDEFIEDEIEYNNTLDNTVDLFISNETDNIINLYYDIKNYFPYMLNRMNSSHLMYFIITYLNCQEYVPWTLESSMEINNIKLIKFENEFKTELNETLKLVNNFYKLQIIYEDWLYFIYYYFNLI